MTDFHVMVSYRAVITETVSVDPDIRTSFNEIANVAVREMVADGRLDAQLLENAQHYKAYELEVTVNGTTVSYRKVERDEAAQQ